MGGEKSNRIPLALLGVGIGVSVSAFSWLGISGLLLVIGKSGLPEEELSIFTSLFYGIVFFIALGGVRAETRRHKLLVSRKIYGDLPSPAPSESKATFKRIKALLWGVFCVISLGWVTPALVIYWADPKQTEWAVAACVCIFSVVAGASFVLKRPNTFKVSNDHLVFFAGLLFGVVPIVWAIV